jgi:hypothetical protein
MTVGIYYAYYNKPEQTENLLFFLKRGYLPQYNTRFIVTSGRNHPPIPGKIDYCDGKTDISNWCRYQDDYDYYIFINSTCRGPFLANYIKTNWVETIISQFDSDIKLVGPILEVASDTDKPFIHAYMWACTREAMEIIRKIDDWDPNCDKDHAVRGAERQITLQVLNSGYNVKSFLAAHKGIDWRNKKYWKHALWCKSYSDPEIPNNYFGTNPHPLEIMFVKNIRPIGRRSVATAGVYDKELKIYSTFPKSLVV